MIRNTGFAVVDSALEDSYHTSVCVPKRHLSGSLGQIDFNALPVCRSLKGLLYGLSVCCVL